MKKSKLSVGLVTGLVASFALAGCGSVKAKDGFLLSYKGYDGQTYQIVTEKMYQEYRKDSKVISTFYDKVLEVMNRDLFQSGKFQGTKSYATIEALAKEDVKAAKVKATESAKTNNTSYEKEWEALLSGEGVEDEKELLQKYIYDQEKKVLDDYIYASLNKAEKLKKSWIETTRPYHIRHILAKVDSGANEYTRGTISASQAKVISDAGLALGRANDTFGGVAKLYSEDGSKDTYGDVGLVTNKVSSSGSFLMVTEFQLAIYIYDAIYGARTGEIVGDLIPGDATDPESIVSKAKDAFANVTRVPYQVFKQLASKEAGGLGDVTDVQGIQVGEGEEAIYPRNILWNKYLNHHEPFVITNDSIVDKDDAGNEVTPAQVKALDANGDPTTVIDPNAVGDEDASVVAVADGDNSHTGFRKASTVGLGTQLGDDTLVLTDEKGNPIFGVRSEYGIHFIIIEKGAFEAEETLVKYYQAYAPSQAEWVDPGIKTYVNYAGFTDSQMVERANAVKDAIKGFDSTYQYNLFKYLLNSAEFGDKDDQGNAYYKAEDRFVISDENSEAGKLVKEIKAYVDRQAAKSDYEQDEGLNLAWRNFLDKFAQQQAERVKYERLIPYGCAVGFTQTKAEYDAVHGAGAYEALYGIGGACYYGNKTK